MSGIVTGRDRGKAGAMETSVVPVASSPQAPLVPVAATRSGRVGAGRRPTILIVTDAPVIVERVARFLRGLGYEVATAASCAAARRSARMREQIHLVLAGPDLELAPGLKLVRWFRSESPATPVLLMRGSLAEVNQCLLDAEQVAVLLRPFTLEQLAHAVRELLVGGRAAAIRGGVPGLRVLRERRRRLRN